MSGNDRHELQQGLRQRHMTMIAFGGIIGAGLFVGSSAVIDTVGPGAVVSYLAAGVLVILVMRMLGEMAVAKPSVFVYLLIAVAELRMRRQLEREGSDRLKVRMWLYPWLTWLAIIAIVAVVASMPFVEDEATRSYVVPSLISLAVVLLFAFGRERMSAARGAGAARSRRPPGSGAAAASG